MNKNTPIILSVLAFIAVLGYSIFNKTKKFLGLVTYSIASFRVHEINLTSVLCKIGIEVNNPSSASVQIRNFKVEIYHVGNDNKRSLLAESPVNQIAIPAKQTVIIPSDLSISTIQAAKLINNITIVIMAGKITELKANILNLIKNSTVIVIKAEILGQYAEKELKW